MVIIINGRPQVGKDTVCEIIKEILGEPFYHNLSSIDAIKHIAKIGGWDGEKTPKSRKFLSDLKDLFTEFNDMPFKSIVKSVKGIISEYEYYEIRKNEYIIFIHIREPQEIQRMAEELDAKTLFVERESVQNELTNHADANVYNYKYDYYLQNNGTLEELKDKIYDYLDYINIRY